MDATRRRIVGSMTLAAALGSLPALTRAGQAFEVTHSDEEWLALLGRNRYEVLRRSATERPYTSSLNDEHRRGTFHCAGCALELFSSAAKFDSGTGWPSFSEPLANSVATTVDRSYGMVRTAVHCTRCGGHLGHVFDDGPRPTRLRYCINGLALSFAQA
jgi:peptide-methionine (R)-S-oxide reductase